MKIEVNVPAYSRERGLAPLTVEQDAVLGAGILDARVIIRANKAGLISLAVHLPALVQDNVPVGRDILYGDWDWFAAGSHPVCIRKIEVEEDALPRPLTGEALAKYEYIMERLRRGAEDRQEPD